MKKSNNESTYYAKNPGLLPDVGRKKLTKDYLPPLTTVSDIDMVILSNGGCLRLIEYKCRGDKPDFAQRFLYRMMSNVLYIGLKVKEYLGLFRQGTFNISKIYKPLFISYENTSLEDGRIWINDKEVSKDEAVKMLRFGKDCRKCFPGQCSVCK